jgi:uncharacterized protein
MNPIEIINKYYPNDNMLKQILLQHSRSVEQKALWIANRHPELKADRVFLSEAAMVHDIGIFLTDAPSIYCLGKELYIRHGFLGAELMRNEGFPRHALICERHTGAGLSLKEIENRQLPVPHHEMVPISIEEQIICFSDMFFSKTKLETEKSIDQAAKSIARYGEEGLIRFNRWCKHFL